MIIRELVSSFGIDFDESGARRAEHSMQRLDRTFNAIGLGLSFAGVYTGLKSMLGLSSSAEEEANVLRQTFGEFSDEVVAWADANALAMSRSSADLQKYAGQLGAVIEPMLGNKQAAAEMSETLAGLSVDLASFFNKGDEETMERLRSGLLGSSEAVDQLGINLRQEHIEAVMAEQGLKAKFKTMSEGEKVQARFLTIMKDTIDKQGDAAKTAGGYANRTKAAEANVKDLGRAIGDKLMPVAKTSIGLFADFSGGLLDITKNSNAVEVGMVGLAYAGGVMASSFIVANAGALFFGAGALVLGVVLEDLYTSLEGGEGHFADFFNAALGEDEWAKILEKWRFVKGELVDVIWEITHPEEMKIRHGENYTRSRNTAMGRYSHLFHGTPYYEDTIKPPPGLAPMTRADGRTGWADAFQASPRQTPVYKGERGMTYNFGRRPLSFETDQMSRYAGREALPFSASLPVEQWPAFMSDERSSILRSSGLTQSLMDSVDGLSGAVQSLPAAASGAPLSLPASTTNNVTNNNLQSGDVHVHVDSGVSPVTLREVRRVAREMVDDNNRSLAESARSRR